jgi:hypothetical protein
MKSNIRKILSEYHETLLLLNYFEQLHLHQKGINSSQNLFDYNLK